MKLTADQLDALPAHTVIQELDEDPSMGNKPHPWVKQPGGLWRCTCGGEETFTWSADELWQDSRGKQLFVIWEPA